MKKITDYTDYDTQVYTQCLLFVKIFFVMMSMAQQDVRAFYDQQLDKWKCPY